MFERKNRGRRLGRLILAFGLMAGAGLALNAQAAGPEPSSTVISMQDVDCQSCGMEAVQALEGMKGVETVSFDRDKAELLVRHRSADVSPDALAAVVRGLGYGAVVGAGKGRYLGDIEFPAELDVSWISRAGEKVDLDEHLVSGKVTVIDFYASWCGPCREVDRAMFSVLRVRGDVAFRKVNVSDWESPVAKQYLTKVPELPYVIVYSKRGRRVEAISGLDLDRLHAAIDRGATNEN